MKTLGAMLIVAAVIGIAAPASAQQVTIGAGDVGVRIGRDHDRWDRDRRWRHRDRVAECRTIRERTVTPRGRVIVETRRVCR